MINSETSEAVGRKPESLDIQALAGRLARWSSGKNRVDTAISGLSLHYWSTPTEPTSYMLAPSLCLIGQGKKRLYLEDQAFNFDARTFLITSVGLPVVSQIVEASEEEPYFGLTLELDLKSIARMILDHEMPLAKAPGKRLGVAVSTLSPNLLDAFLRLIDLLDSPEDIPVLAPLIQQEIYHRLLKSEQGPRLRQIVSSESHSYQIARAIDWLTANYDKTFRIEELAEKTGLSPSAFHNHFKTMTAMSPLQFQKKIRLNEARRLMLTNHLDAASAAFEVGYESPSQFNREYSRMFGAPPLRDIKNMMGASAPA